MRYTLIILSSLTLLTACNAMEGLGKDFQALGNGLEKSADDNNNYKAEPGYTPSPQQNNNNWQRY